jgi:hypothetical protein
MTWEHVGACDDRAACRARLDIRSQLARAFVDGYANGRVAPRDAEEAAADARRKATAYVEALEASHAE